MRTLLVSVTVTLALVVPRPSSSQTAQLPAGAPVVYQSGFYYPSGPTVFFDGAVMVRVGTFEGIPLYLDPTRDPVNVVLVPVSRQLMRPYERSADAIAADLVAQPPPLEPDLSEPSFEATPLYFDIGDPTLLLGRPAVPPTRSSVPAVPLPRTSGGRGIWIEFDGRMWTPSGPGPALGPRLKIIGYSFGFPVFQEGARCDRIFVPATKDGPLIQYDRRQE